MSLGFPVQYVFDLHDHFGVLFTSVIIPMTAGIYSLPAEYFTVAIWSLSLIYTISGFKVIIFIIISQCNAWPFKTSYPIFFPFKGKKRFEARQLLIDALVEKKLFRGKKSHAMTLPVCR